MHVCMCAGVSTSVSCVCVCLSMYCHILMNVRYHAIPCVSNTCVHMQKFIRVVVCCSPFYICAIASDCAWICDCVCLESFTTCFGLRVYTCSIPSLMCMCACACVPFCACIYLSVYVFPCICVYICRCILECPFI